VKENTTIKLLAVRYLIVKVVWVEHTTMKKASQVLEVVRYVVPVPRQIPELVLGHQRVLHVPLVSIRYYQTLLHVRPVPPVPRQILEPYRVQYRVFLVTLVNIHHLRTLIRVHLVLTANIKIKIPNQVAKTIVPLVSLSIVSKPRVLLVLLDNIKTNPMKVNVILAV
jgi:hypothetical protein